MAYFDEIDNEVISKLGKLAEKYIYEDSNSSMIKQGMILEYICHLFLSASGEIKKIKTEKYPPTLNDMLDYLYAKKLIDPSSGGKQLCEDIRLNRNKAAHDLYESTSSAFNTILGLSDLCKVFVIRINKINSTERKVTWNYQQGFAREPDSQYQIENPELMNDFKSIFDNFKLSEEAEKQLRSSSPTGIYDF